MPGFFLSLPNGTYNFHTVPLCRFTALSQNVITSRSVCVADGDIFTLLGDNNTQHRIRLEGIDAPESGQAFGNRSRQYLSNLIVGKRLKVTYKEKDRYGRILGKVSTVSIQDVNLEMIRVGLAWYYSYSYFNDEKEYAEGEKKASENGLI